MSPKVMTLDDLKLIKGAHAKELENKKYIKEFRNKTIVVKYGGSALEVPKVISYLIDDLIFLKQLHINVVLLHGGSRHLNDLLKKKKIEHKSINGIRVTSKEILDDAIKVFTAVNNSIVDEINIKGQGEIKGIGLNGNEVPITISEYLDKATYQYVGKIVDVNVEFINALDSQYIPVLSSLSQTKDHQPLNINADTNAAEIAKKLNAYKLIIVTDKDGILGKDGKLLSSVNESQIKAMLEEGTISEGMVPKVLACLSAIEGNVKKVHIINGTKPDALVKELFTDSGIGTEIVKQSKVSKIKYA
jgi:acetylglutamate kinase